MAPPDPAGQLRGSTRRVAEFPAVALRAVDDHLVIHVSRAVLPHCFPARAGRTLRTGGTGCRRVAVLDASGTQTATRRVTKDLITTSCSEAGKSGTMYGDPTPEE
jgi:hypothetical protein